MARNTAPQRSATKTVFKAEESLQQADADVLYVTNDWSGSTHQRAESQQLNN